MMSRRSDTPGLLADGETSPSLVASSSDERSSVKSHQQQATVNLDTSNGIREIHTLAIQDNFSIFIYAGVDLRFQYQTNV